MSIRQFKNNRYVKLNGLGKWRSLYVKLLHGVHIDYLLELGSGTPEFLENFKNVKVRMAVDLNTELNMLYEQCNIEIRNFDLEKMDSVDLDNLTFDYVVCSDVFEHLVDPLQTLNTCAALTGEIGCLISHVPNEFQFRHILSVMLGWKKTVAFFEANEWESPHVRFFSDLGYKKFLELKYRYNIPLNPLTYGTLKNTLLKSNCLPYTFQSGPTYLSTNSEEKYRFWIDRLQVPEPLSRN